MLNQLVDFQRWFCVHVETIATSPSESQHLGLLFVDNVSLTLILPYVCFPRMTSIRKQALLAFTSHTVPILRTLLMCSCGKSAIFRSVRILSFQRERG
jgi:hypothetical protein